MSVALVTGSSTGIGQATAAALARKGFVTYAAMRNPAAAAPLTAIAASENVRIVPIEMDVDSDASVEAAVGSMLKAEGRVDVLVNNAGIGGGSHVEDTPLEAFRQVMETNYFGVLRCTKAVVPSMREQRSGCIVNISSLAGQMAVGSHAAYSASKWAVEGLSECLAQEMKPFGVRVAIVEPGVIMTPIFTKAEAPNAATHYPHARRMGALFTAALTKQFSPPEVVADIIAGIATGDSWRLRYPAGADAEAGIAWRKSVSDEAFIDSNADSDAAFAASMKAAMGFDIEL